MFQANTSIATPRTYRRNTIARRLPQDISMMYVLMYAKGGRRRGLQGTQVTRTRARALSSLLRKEESIMATVSEGRGEPRRSGAPGALRTL